ncbi:mannonate dehydratase [Rufibacter tibetensis]|uniref:Mannonate dehydratase n=2 Tax=Rufibacter tibetensis TaxID=512763 RepID=A0A0P0D0I9_9BACT|nr:mannonate dehydratase [Rufibacter tibetensis]
MNIQRMLSLLLLAFIIQTQPVLAQGNIPHLQKIGDKQQLVVNGKPFLMLAGELGNSTASTMESMVPVWPRLKELNLNTVLVPVYWELLEPEEGKFEYQLVEDLIKEARKHDLKLVLLWFGAWKNSMSSHAPAWVKVNQKRFPRAKSQSGESQEILTPFSENNLKADLNAYQQLLRQTKKVNAAHQTVILMQPENEIGMLPSARDYHPAANQKFKEEVPQELMSYLVKNKKNLNPEFSAVWQKTGYKAKGTWEEVFGKGLPTDEIFMAYYFARYTDQVTAAGKKEYALPAFVNAALNRPNAKPGEYPSAGPLPHILDVWKAGSPHIDFYSPDFYNPQFKQWSDLYVRQGNPLFVPEHKFDNTIAAKALFAIGHYEALGFSPFSIEQVPGTPLNAMEQKLSKVYDVLHQIKPLLDKNRGQHRIEGVLLDKEVKEATIVLGDYEFTAGHTFNLGWEPNAKAEEWEPAGAILIQTGDNEFYYAGFGVSLKMKNLKNPKARVGILKTDRGAFKDGKWTVYQHLNGDQTHQGRHIRSFVDDVSIQRFTLYEYE